MNKGKYRDYMYKEGEEGDIVYEDGNEYNNDGGEEGEGYDQEYEENIGNEEKNNEM